MVSVDLPEPASTSVLNGPTSPTAPSKLEQTLLQVTTSPQPHTQQGRNSPQSQELPRKSSLEIPKAFISSVADIHKGPSFLHSPQPARPKAHTIGEQQSFSGFCIEGMCSCDHVHLQALVSSLPSSNICLTFRGNVLLLMSLFLLRVPVSMAPSSDKCMHCRFAVD